LIFVCEDIGVDVGIELDGPLAEGLHWVLTVPKVVERVRCWLRAVTTEPWNLPPKVHVSRKSPAHHKCEAYAYRIPAGLASREHVRVRVLFVFLALVLACPVASPERKRNFLIVLRGAFCLKHLSKGGEVNQLSPHSNIHNVADLAMTEDEIQR
jgi:hypothetical protein